MVNILVQFTSLSSNTFKRGLKLHYFPVATLFIPTLDTTTKVVTITS